MMSDSGESGEGGESGGEGASSSDEEGEADGEEVEVCVRRGSSRGFNFLLVFDRRGWDRVFNVLLAIDRRGWDRVFNVLLAIARRGWDRSFNVLLAIDRRGPPYERSLLRWDLLVALAGARAGIDPRQGCQLLVEEFADITWEEFRDQHLGASQTCSATLKGNHKVTDVVFPDTKDWREAGIVSPVKNQGSCGSCWTFSTTGALEAAYTQLTGKSVSLSEQQLVDCATDYNNFGCNGGLPSQAFEYIKSNGGLDTEEAYPYLGVNSICKFKPESVGVKVVDSVNITQGAEDELKHAVGVVRPVSVAFEVVRGFRFYKSGVYTSDTCGSSPMDVNHAVLAVGYGVEDGIPYWLIKNSWGTQWGDDGYFKMEMGKNMCGGCPSPKIFVFAFAHSSTSDDFLKLNLSNIKHAPYT